MAALRLVLASLLLAACGTDSSTTGTDTSTSADDTTSTTVGSGGGGGATTSSMGGAPDGGASTGGASTGGASTGGGGAEGGATGTGGSAPAAGYGALSGTCGEIDLPDLMSPSPEFLENVLDFSARAPFMRDYLSPGGQYMYDKGNLGGSSLYSEIYAYEVLYRCDQAEFLKTEGEIVYAMEGKKTDLLVRIDGEKVGVSVVRAESYPKGSAYTVQMAKTVLEGKLSDIKQSTINVDPQDAWHKQILAVIAQSELHRQAIADAYPMIDPSIKADTIVYVTTTEGDDDYIYYNQ